MARYSSQSTPAVDVGSEVADWQAHFLRDNAAVVRLHVERFRRMVASADSDALHAAEDVATLADDFVTRVLTALATPAPDSGDPHECDECDECGRPVPAEPVSGLHAESCSLHPANTVPTDPAPITSCRPGDSRSSSPPAATAANRRRDDAPDRGGSLLDAPLELPAVPKPGRATGPRQRPGRTRTSGRTEAPPCGPGSSSAPTDIGRCPLRSLVPSHYEDDGTCPVPCRPAGHLDNHRLEGRTVTETTTIRNAGLDEMVAILKEQQARKLDLVAPGVRLRVRGGQLVLAGLEPLIEDDGVTDPNGVYTPTEIFDEGLAARLEIPRGYLRRLRETRLDLFDLNVNGLLRGKQVNRAGQPVPEIVHPADPRTFLVRLFRGEETGVGVARALLSNRYARLDNLDGLMAMLAGITEAGIDPGTLSIEQCDLTDRRMYVRVTAPEIQALAPQLLKGYRNPFANPEAAAQRVRGRDLEAWRRVAAAEGMGYTEADGGEPVVFAGFTFTNSEVGNGRWSLLPQIVVRICKNGLTFTADAFGRTHLGAALDEGVVEWSADTQDKNLALVTAQTRDAVGQFLAPQYAAAKVAQLEENAGAPVTAPEDTIKVLAKKLAFTDEQANGILRMFVLGGQLTAGGVLQAVTSYSQTVPDADAAFDLETKALAAMELAAARR